jgi:hypothetical protein
MLIKRLNKVPVPFAYPICLSPFAYQMIQACVATLYRIIDVIKDKPSNS